MSTAAPLVDPEHAAWLGAEEARLLDFGAGSRHPAGGFGWLEDDGRIDVDRPRELWITCRMTHVHACAHLRGRPGADALADHGVAALSGLFHDAAHGGWWKQVDAAGAPTTRAKTAYEHAFVVLAASSALAAGRPGADALLEQALGVLLERFWDPDHAMVVEEWDESWTRLDDYRGLNATMHSVEALLAAADVTGQDASREVAQQIVTRVVRDLAPAYDWLLPEHFDRGWNPLLGFNADQPAHPFRPYGATVGHSLEWARLTLHLAAALERAGGAAPGWMVANAVALLDRAVDVGWSPDGSEGFVYTVDWDGAPVVRERMHWVAAEAIGAAAAAYDATGETRHAERYRAWWDHVERVFVDLAGGSWWHERSPEGGPSATTWSGKPDVYHAVQATWIPRLPLAPTLAAALRDGARP